MFRLGWRPDLEDSAFLAWATAPVFSIPSNFQAAPALSFRGILKVENQGDMNSCTGHGGSTGFESLIYQLNGGFIQMSRMYCYLTGQRMSGIRGDNGATITGCVKGMVNGLCTEDVFPYPSRYSNFIPTSAVQQAKSHTILGHQKLYNYEEMWQWVSTGKGPIIVGFPWYDRVAGSKGIIDESSLAGSNPGGHCICIAGYTGESAYGAKMLDSINSHGRSSGDNGHFQWTNKALNKMAAMRDRRGNYVAEFIGITNISGFDPARIIDFAGAT